MTRAALLLFAALMASALSLVGASSAVAGLRTVELAQQGGAEHCVAEDAGQADFVLAICGKKASSHAAVSCHQGPTILPELIHAGIRTAGDRVHSFLSPILRSFRGECPLKPPQA